MLLRRLGSMRPEGAQRTNVVIGTSRECVTMHPSAM